VYGTRTAGCSLHNLKYHFESLPIPPFLCFKFYCLHWALAVKPGSAKGFLQTPQPNLPA
jgi:hypothetical protein